MFPVPGAFRVSVPVPVDWSKSSVLAADGTTDVVFTVSLAMVPTLVILLPPIANGLDRLTLVLFAVTIATLLFLNSTLPDVEFMNAVPLPLELSDRLESDID
jgi:hypothetical protein